MANASRQQIDTTLFEGFTPLNSLDGVTLKKLAHSAAIENIPAGEFLFERGDSRQRTFYLLEGEIELCSPLFPTQKVTAGTEAGRYPMAHSFPRQFTAVTISNARVLVLPVDISELMSREAGNAKQAAAEQRIWEKRWLESPLLRRLSAEHKQSLLASMEELSVQAGQVILNQDEPADSYYVLKKGRCSVSRKPSPSARDVKLAELSEGQGFGEEALITDVPRNASVTMLTDGIVLRLSKEAFISLMAKPLLHHLPFQHAIKLVEQGAILVDVRTPEEFEIDGLIGSLNMPIPVLRLKASRLNRDRTYIVYSNAGQTSSVAVFLMLQQGLNACVLEGGLNNVPKHRMKNGGLGDSGQQEQTNGLSAGTVLPFPNNSATKPADNVDWNHVSDDVLWRTTLGYRDDAGVEASMNAQPQNHQHVGDASIQGFDDIRLFTTIDSFQDIKIAPDQGAEEAYPTATSSAGNSKLFTSPAPNPNRPRSPAASGTYRPQPVSQWTPKVSRGWGRRIAVAAILIVVLVSGWVGYFYMTNGKMPENLQSASPLILEQQRKLDAKVNRLLDAIESMPALKGQVKDRKDTEPPPASPESQAKQNPSQP